MASLNFAGNSPAIESTNEFRNDTNVDANTVSRKKRTPEDQARHAAFIRKSSGRRRLIDPTTTEKDYSKAEIEFMQAMQEYKKASGRQFPTWSEVLEVLQTLGYRKPSANAELLIDAQGGQGGR